MVILQNFSCTISNSLQKKSGSKSYKQVANIKTTLVKSLWL